MFSKDSYQAKSYKTVVLVSNGHSKALRAVLSRIPTAQPAKDLFHVGYTYAEYKDRDTLLHIYSAESASESLQKVVRSPDLVVQLLDYEEGDPSRWVSALSRCPPGLPVLVVVLNQKTEHHLSHETLEQIQLALRSICLAEGFSLLYCSDPGAVAGAALSFVGLSRFQMQSSDARDFLIGQDPDSWSKIAALAPDASAVELERRVQLWRDEQSELAVNYAAAVPPKKKASVMKKKTGHVAPKKVLSYTEFLASLAK